MASESWMERSLRRSSKLGQDVLEKAKRRSVNQPGARASPIFSHNKRSSERHFSHANLDCAFGALVENMSETTRQCKMFYKSIHRPEAGEREHVRRYHSQDMLKSSDQRQNTAVLVGRDAGTFEDFVIEVSPGTYSITATMQDTTPVTKTVCLIAGESKSLTFNL